MTPEQAIAKLKSEFKRTMLRLPIILGNEAINVTLDNFRKQGFITNIGAIDPWIPRKRAWGKKTVRPGALLVKSGALRRATRIAHINQDGVKIVNDMPYARAHNEGAHGHRHGHRAQHLHKKSICNLVKEQSESKSQRSYVDCHKYKKSIMAWCLDYQ